jgi:hypothetical protein
MGTSANSSAAGSGAEGTPGRSSTKTTGMGR